MAVQSKDASVFSFLKEGLYEAAVSALNRIGKESAEVMKNALLNADYPKIHTGELHDSITYAIKPSKTAKYFPHDQLKPGNPSHGPVGPRATEQSIITPVNEDLTLKVGTRDKAGKYVNYGTGPHKTFTDSEEFVANIYEWCKFHGFDEDFAVYLIKRIIEGGTSATPFLPPAREYVEMVGKLYMDAAVSKVLKAIPKVKRTISEKGMKVEIGLGMLGGE